MFERSWLARVVIATHPNNAQETFKFVIISGGPLVPFTNGGPCGYPLHGGISANGSGYPLFTHSGLPLHGGMYSGIPLGHGGLGRLVMEERVGATLIEMQGVRSGGR